MRLVVLGLGQVGLALLDLLDSQRDCGEPVGLVAAADSEGVFYPGQSLPPSEIASAKRSGRLQQLGGWLPGTDAKAALSAVEADMVVDCMTTNFVNGQPSLDILLSALERGMDVVTANKGPLAVDMPDLLRSAERNGASLKYSATVGGGTPFIDFGRLLAAGGEISSLRGILNGTTNYVLTRMEEGEGPAEAIADAKRAGIAETNPSNDLHGLDSAAKIVILANSLCGRSFSLRDVAITGIDGVDGDMIGRARKEGRSVKLVCTFTEGSLSVKPEVIPKTERLCVSGTLNSLEYSMAGGSSYVLSGPGAGAKETASAIMRDIGSIMRSVG